MSHADYYKHGDANAICDICGFKFKHSELTKNWKNQMVCRKDYEIRHPQDFVRGVKDIQTFPDARPETAIIEAAHCTGSNAVAGTAQAGCAIAGMETDLGF